MKAIFLSLLMIVMLAPSSWAESRKPSGYVVDIALAGEDATLKTVIVRDGKEIAAKLMMPVFDGDVVFVRDPESQVTLESSGGVQVKVGRDAMRHQVKGEIATGDDSWNILTSIAGVFAGEGDQAPENMLAKGDAPKVPAAIRGSNFITPRDALDIVWAGGKAPYAISLIADGKEKVLIGGQTETSAHVVIGAGSRPAAEKFTLVLSDAKQQKVQIRFRVADRLPDDGPKASAIAEAAWLTSVQKGAWSIEAMQMLRQQGKSAAATALADRVAAGWRYGE